MIAIPLLQYCVDIKSNMALYRCFKVNASRFLGAAIVNFFDTSYVCQWGGVSGLRCIVDELKRTNQEGPRWSSTKSAKKQLSMALLRLWVKSVLSGRLNWARLTGILDPWNLFPQKFVRGRSVKILSLKNLALYSMYESWIPFWECSAVSSSCKTDCHVSTVSRDKSDLPGLHNCVVGVALFSSYGCCL